MLKYLLLLVVLFAFSPATRVAAYNFAPPIEPIAKQKITAKSVKSTLTQYQTRWKTVQAKPNKTKVEAEEFAPFAILGLVLLALIGLPLGYGLGVVWLWISSLSILGLSLLLIIALFFTIDYNTSSNIANQMADLGFAVLCLLLMAFLTLLLLDMAALAIIAWLPWFWIVFGVLALALGLLLYFLSTL